MAHLIPRGLMAGDSRSESVASQVRGARKLSPDGTKAIYDLTSGVDFSKPKRTARAIAQVLWEEDVQSWWTWRGAGPAFHPTRKVELRLPSGHDRKVAKAAKEFNKSFERDAFGLDESPTDHLDDFLALADLRGIESHGVARLGRYVTGLKKGFMKPTDQSRIVKETKATALMDGGQSLGQVVGKRGMDLAIRKARDTAIGVVAVRNSNHYGIAGYYTLMALEHDLMGVSMTNAGPLVVPTFGRTAILGTNPISLAAPAKKENAFVLDMATSTVPRGKVEVYNRLGQPMPHGWAVDETGRSSTDPKRVLNALANRLGGGLLPLGGEGEDLGGHKGYGLALMVDVLSGVLSGAATGLQVYADEQRPNVGHFFMALDPAAFRPLDEFRRDMDRLARELKDSPKAHGQDRIYVHGEKSFARMEKYRQEGIPLDPKVVENLKKIGADLGVPWSV